jgi:propanol-preferring alcohol dehydrogenase
LDPYNDMVRREAEIIGSADHLASEIVVLLEMARRGSLDLADVISNTVPLDVAAVNDAFERLEAFGDDIRTVIIP